MSGGRHIPVRMCVVCRRRFPKAELSRYALPPKDAPRDAHKGAGDAGGKEAGERVEEDARTDGRAAFALLADAAQNARGRGCYVCADPDCQEKFGKTGRIRRKRKGVSRHG